MQMVKLKNICVGKGEYGIAASAEEYAKEKYRYLRITDISDFGDLLNNDCKSVSCTGCEKYLLSDDEIVFARTGNSTGRAFFYERKYGSLVYAGFLIKFHLDKKKVNPKYLKYYTISKTYKDWIANGPTGSTRGNMSEGDFADMPVFLPNREVQDILVTMMELLDDKIVNNHAICADLEAMAKLLYDYWFVQFDFPDENGKPYKSSGGKMVWNEELKREIPDGWEVKDITDVCDVIDCLHSKKPKYCYEDNAFYLLTLENLTNDGHIDLSNRFYVSKSDYDIWTSKIEVHEGDFVVTNAGRAGDIGRIPKDVRCAIGRNLTAIRPVNVNSFYLNMFLHSFYVYSQIMSSLDQGSFFKSFNVYAIKKLKVLIPNDIVMKKAVLQFSNVITKVEMLHKENQQLAYLRDFLLPMLMNGQVKVGKV